MANSAAYALNVMNVLESRALLTATRRPFGNVGQHYSVAFVASSSSTVWLTYGAREEEKKLIIS